MSPTADFSLAGKVGKRALRNQWFLRTSFADETYGLAALRVVRRLPHQPRFFPFYSRPFRFARDYLGECDDGEFFYWFFPAVLMVYWQKALSVDPTDFINHDGAAAGIRGRGNSVFVRRTQAANCPENTPVKKSGILKWASLEDRAAWRLRSDLLPPLSRILPTFGRNQK